MAALEEARSVRFEVDYLGEEPKISAACKNFMAYRVAAVATDGKTSKPDADRQARRGPRATAITCCAGFGRCACGCARHRLH